MWSNTGRKGKQFQQYNKKHSYVPQHWYHNHQSWGAIQKENDALKKQLQQQGKMLQVVWDCP
eukprot:6875258-Karenia_brevis.AAC.1